MAGSGPGQCLPPPALLPGSLPIKVGSGSVTRSGSGHRDWLLLRAGSPFVPLCRASPSARGQSPGPGRSEAPALLSRSRQRMPAPDHVHRRGDRGLQEIHHEGGRAEREAGEHPEPGGDGGQPDAEADGAEPEQAGGAAERVQHLPAGAAGHGGRAGQGPNGTTTSRRPHGVSPRPPPHSPVPAPSFLSRSTRPAWATCSPSSSPPSTSWS